MNARQGAAEIRRKAYLKMLSRSLLEPTAGRTIHENLWRREQIFVPAFYWTPVWTVEARRAYYGLPR